MIAREQVRLIDISWPISEFRRFSRSWEQYEEQHMDVIVRHVKRSVVSIHKRSIFSFSLSADL